QQHGGDGETSPAARRSLAYPMWRRNAPPGRAWWGHRGSNPDGSSRAILSRLRLPIPPCPQTGAGLARRRGPRRAAWGGSAIPGAALRHAPDRQWVLGAAGGVTDWAAPATLFAAPSADSATLCAAPDTASVRIASCRFMLSRKKAMIATSART